MTSPFIFKETKRLPHHARYNIGKWNQIALYFLAKGKTEHVEHTQIGDGYERLIRFNVAKGR
jgi:hypothetical protein